MVVKLRTLPPEKAPRKVPMTTLGSAQTYEEWKAAALALDEQTGRARWRSEPRSRRYDYETIAFRLDEIRSVRASGDPHRLLFYLNEGVHGNMGGMGSTALYGYAEFGTKDLVTDYIRELASAIEAVAEVDDAEISLAEKMEFFRRASHCYGRTALMFSGAGSLGPFHLGVTRALHEQGLLPTVLSGASAGAFVCAIVGTRRDDELATYLASDELSRLYLSNAGGSVAGDRITVEHLRSMIAAMVPDLTFEEAFHRTGRKINISVAPNQLHQRSRLLNAVTSPNVFIREAILASCAIPGIFPPVVLAAKNVDGERQPYVRSRTWVDGSVTDDQPAKRLARLYGVNHFVTSQANPAVLWTIRDTGWQDSMVGRLWDVSRNATKELFRAAYPFAMELTKGLYPLNVVSRLGFSIATQDYTADVNILPTQRLWDPRKLLAVLSEDDTMELVLAGERATWPKIEMMRNCTLISRTLDRLTNDLESRSLRPRPLRVVADHG